MFEFARDLKRLFSPSFSAPRDGLTGGDPALFELLSVDLLVREARACDIHAGRIGATDRPARQLRQSAAWLEVARRTGDAASLRKAASAAEAAADGFAAAGHRGEAWAAARRQQALCGLTGAELFGSDGLSAAADLVLTDALRGQPKGVSAALIEIDQARVAAERALAKRNAAAALAAILASDAAITVLETRAKDRPGKLAAAQGRMIRAEILMACGLISSDERLLDRALEDAERAVDDLDGAYQPLTLARAVQLKGEILTALGETTGEAGELAEAVDLLTGVLEDLSRDHSPLDWAAAQAALGRALHSLAETTGQIDALEKAQGAYDRAMTALRGRLGLVRRAAIAQARAGLIARAAEQTGDLVRLSEAEAAMRCELAACDPNLDPVGWAVSQISLAEVYRVRMALTGRDRGERAQAAIAYDAALDVFAEHGLAGLSDLARSGLERLKAL